VLCPGGSDAEEEGEEEDVEFDGGLRIPGRVYGRLFEYQRTGGAACHAAKSWSRARDPAMQVFHMYGLAICPWAVVVGGLSSQCGCHFQSW
jgi:hypothetical protein